jgi:DNA-binding transcriptional regulator of glucitol operon
MHVTLLVLVPACAALCDWQVHRALSGNTLSWAYVFEWPFFAGYGTYVWWRLVHDQMGRVAPDVPMALGGPTEPVERVAEPDQEDEEMTAYNRYLAELNASGRAKRW